LASNYSFAIRRSVMLTWTHCSLCFWYEKWYYERRLFNTKRECRIYFRIFQVSTNSSSKKHCGGARIKYCLSTNMVWKTILFSRCE